MKNSRREGKKRALPKAVILLAGVLCICLVVLAVFLRRNPEGEEASAGAEGEK
ncbi:hypothetical protein H6B07_01430, partial [Mediterraneibacter glycyrrhizinilyticus]|nr:hypothetical protein [Mediterraneibacter glycyrrhizinilyticus]